MPAPALLVRPGYADLIRNTPGLVAYWRMRDSSGTTARDEKAAANATLTGSPTLRQGTPVADGAGSKFNGSTQYAQAAVNLSAHSQVSLSFWLYWDSFANTDNMAFEYTANANSNNGFFIDPNSGAPASGLVQILARGTTLWADSFTRPSAAVWHHWLITFDIVNRVNTAYIDGALQTLTAVNHGTPSGTFANSTLNFMSRNGTSLFGAGRLSEVALFGGVILTQNVARTHYNSGMGT